MIDDGSIALTGGAGSQKCASLTNECKRRGNALVLDAPHQLECIYGSALRSLGDDEVRMLNPFALLTDRRD